MKIYLAGKITGDENYREKFAKAQAELENDGHTVLNPAVLPEGLLKSDYMKICFAMIDCADQLYLLPGWQDSEGAKVEYAYCLYVGKKIKDSELVRHLKALTARQMMNFRAEVSRCFAQRLKLIRESQELNQSDLGSIMRVSRGSISFYEKAERVPDIDFLAQVCLIFKVSADWLLGLDKEVE